MTTSSLTIPLREITQPVGSASIIYGYAGKSDYYKLDGFQNELDAVISASNSFNPVSISEDREYMGAILKIKDQFFYTVDHGRSGQDTLTIRLLIPKNVEIAAYWHTHGKAGWDRQYFSDEDYGLVKSTNKPLYLADHTGQLKILLPGSKNTISGNVYKNGLPYKQVLITGSKVANSQGKLIEVET